MGGTRCWRHPETERKLVSVGARWERVRKAQRPPRVHREAAGDRDPDM